MKPLFVYGTLRGAAWRDAILGAAYPARPATLRDHCRIANASGYLSLRATPPGTSSVAGMLLDLDELGWRIADAWEDAAVTFPQNDGADPVNDRGSSNTAHDSSGIANGRKEPTNSTELTGAPADVTLYARAEVTVDTADGPVSATAYVCPDPAGVPVEDDARLALRSDAEVEAAIAAFVPHMRAIRARHRTV